MHLKKHPFGSIPDAQYTESVYQLIAEYARDPTPNKTDLMVGVYKTDEGRIYTLPSVNEAKRRLFADPEWHHGYRSSQIGTARYLQTSIDLFFGKESELVRDRRVPSTQTLGASGACHMAAILLREHYQPWKSEGVPTVYMPRETWSNHANIFKNLGIHVDYLPYFDRIYSALNFLSFHSAVAALPEQSVLVLQTSGQNPTGCDLTREQWSQLASTCISCGHTILFDAAYYGMATGSVHEDTEGVRMCAENGVPVILAATYSKAFGLYSERVGFLSITAPDKEVARRLEMHLRLITRYQAGGFPAFGSTIVESILSDPELRSLWDDDVVRMAAQLQGRRNALRTRLEELGTPGNWQFITSQKGMFCLTNLTIQQIDMLRTIHHIYLQDNGRLSISGLNGSNIEHVARSMDAVVRATEGRMDN